MIATSENSHHWTTFLVLLILPMTIVQPFSFSITNFEDSESAALVGYAGVAKIVNGTILLNSLTYSGVGRAIYGQPIHLKNSSNQRVTDFSTRFSFTIQSPNSIYGDGFAFYVAPLAYQIPKTDLAGVRLGLYDENIPIVAVEFDTFINELDPPLQHVGINNGSVVSLNYTKFDIESNKGNMGHALITYNASAKLLAVSWFFERTSSASTPNAYLSYQIDLAELLPEWVALGFSGSTGSSIEENVIHSWEFSSSLDLTISPANEENVIATKYKGRRKVVVVAVIWCTIFVIVVVGVTCWMMKKRRNEDGFGFDREAMPRRFGYDELVAATNGFADDRRVGGEGGHGEVYKGFVSDLGRVVAVKRVCSDVEDSEGIFRNEVKIISRLIHKNLVQLIGWCEEEGELLIVMEYLDNGSLETHLFGNRRSLKWGVRYNIALGVARALRYLHEEVEQCVVHRDIKSSNVLLDTDFNTKVSDFGIAKLVDPRLRTQRTKVVGTYGYLAPEYVKEGRVSKESDIYSFGVLALEIACGRRSYDDVGLMNWVWKHYVDGKILNGADEKMKRDFDVSEMRCLLTVGLWCTLQDHKERPTAEQVINVLQQKVSLPILSTKHA
ncbi:L-type lectin-domain containing receptor kinase IX.1-like [Vigna unguiculata]|uniref:L-type lectin-domain containing receptor kinase IX.1-like n=1 Tax=Vigna unguiculata TaxID=3917 RepID=UPI00101649C9|nr:L-type lectin-domain containing receptor kinase IX.1-like [Vigna unguiculata]